MTVSTYLVSHIGPKQAVGQAPSTDTVLVQRAGGHGRVDVPRMVQGAQSKQIGSHSSAGQIAGPGSGTVTVVHETCSGGGGCGRMAVGAGAGEAAIKEQVAA